jgi:hypothetical protein
LCQAGIVKIRVLLLGEPNGEIKEEMQRVLKGKADVVGMVKTQGNKDEERISIALRELAELKRWW